VRHAAALLVSPYRGLLVYSPIVLMAAAGAWVARRAPADRSVLALAGVAVLLASLLLHAGFHFWTGSHCWGPRFLASPHVLLLPAFAFAFERWPGAARAVPVLAALQLFSVLLPASTEEYVRFHLDRVRPTPCDEWRLECSAVGQRIPRALAAIRNTALDRPGVVVRGRPLVAPDVVLDTSDYRTVYWWPVRAAFRLGALPASVALLICLAGALAALALQVLALRAAAGTPAANPRLPLRARDPVERGNPDPIPETK
jgi:hypothetical protein